jgi:hypothetical protein
MLERILCIGMILFGVMRLIEYKQINLLHSDERVNQTCVENFGSTNDDHIILEMFVPELFLQSIRIHVAVATCDFMIKIAIEYRILLED